MSLYFKDLKINIICLVQTNNIFKCLFGQKSKLAKSHSINIEETLKNWIIIQKKFSTIEKVPVEGLLFL